MQHPPLGSVGCQGGINVLSCDAMQANLDNGFGWLALCVRVRVTELVEPVLVL